MIKRKKILKILLSYTTIIVVCSYLGISSYLLQTNTIKPKTDGTDNLYEDAVSDERDIGVGLISSDIEYRKDARDEVKHIRQENLSSNPKEVGNDEENVDIDYISGEIIVGYDGEISEFAREFSVSDYDIEEVLEGVFLIKSEKLRIESRSYLSSNRDEGDSNSIDPFTESLIADLQSKGVVYAQPNFIYKTSFLANDEYLSSQWALDNSIDADIDAFEAWEIRPKVHKVKVAVIDTGVDYTHPDLTGKILRDEDNNIIGYDFVNDDNDPLDDKGHGTHCAGIIGAQRNNEIGIAGVCSNCQIMPIKGLDEEGYGNDAVLAQAINFAIDNGANVISASWGSYGYSRLIKDSVNRAYEEGVVFISSAGNDNFPYRSYPASFEHVISVSATNKYDRRDSYSNYGETIDIAAPGSEILSTFLPGADLDGEDDNYCEDANFGTIGDGYGYCTGTSMAAPHVAGITGLILAHNPDFTVDQVIERLITATDDLGDEGWDPYYGYGRANAYYAVNTGEIYDFVYANVTYPNYGKLFGKRIIIKGVADAKSFDHYTLSAYHEEHPDEIFVLYEGFESVIDGDLYEWDTVDLASGTWYIDLIVYDKDENTASSEIMVRIDNDLHEGWPKYRYYEDARHNNSPVFGDIDNDGYDEVVYGSVEGYVYAYNHDGTYVDGVWPVHIGSEYGQANTPSIADMDNDGDMEIIVGAINGLNTKLLFVLNGDGTNYPGWPKFNSGYDYQSAKWIMGECTIADIDQDGLLEILVGMYDYKLHAVHLDGTEAPGWPIEVFPPGEDSHNQYQNKFVTAPVVGDIDGDGDSEVVFGNWRYVYAYHHDGRDHPVVGEWPVDTIPEDLELPESWQIMGGISPPAMGDVDGDGLNEVVTTSVPRDIRPSTQYQTFVWNGDGTAASGWPVYTYYDNNGVEQNIDESLSSVALGDLDLDGYPEIVTGGREGGIYVWDGDGTQFHDETSAKSGIHWPIRYDYDELYGMCKNPVIADIDDDNLPEILIGELEGFKILERDGTETWTKMNTNVEESSALGDIDSDGKFEIINFSDYEVNVWDTDNDYTDEKVEWGQFRNSAIHDGLYKPKDRYDIVDMVIDDLAGRLRRDRSIIELHEKEFVHWSDSCMGVRRDGEICAPEMIPGYKIILVVHYVSRDVFYEYHTDLSSIFRLKGRLGGEDLPPRP